MRYIKIILLLSLVACGQKQTEHNTSDNSLFALLEEGEYQADVMDQVTLSLRTQELMQKFEAGIQNNPDWFLEAKDKAEEIGEPIPYDERIGMTEEEFTEFMDLMKNNNGMEMAKSSTETISIKHADGKIFFESSRALDILNDVSIDISGQLATIGQIKLTQIESVNVTDDNNSLKSKWTGVTWRYEESNKEQEDLKTAEDYQDLNMKVYIVTLGQLESTGKLYMQIQKSEIEHGQKKFHIQLPFIFSIK